MYLAKRKKINKKSEVIIWSIQENIRDKNGKYRTKTIAYLGRDKDPKTIDRINKFKEITTRHKEQVAKYKEEINQSIRELINTIKCLRSL